QLELPVRRQKLLGFFPGSTIGNMTSEEAVRFLDDVRVLLGKNAQLLIGADLVKPETILLPAYDDAQGVTAAFNLNILARINRELGGTFKLELFEHRAVFNAEFSRVEMHLRAKVAHTVHVGRYTFSFAEGETIHTENSHKYTVQSFTDLAEAAGWTAE